jgi:hypothetical protein
MQGVNSKSADPYGVTTFGKEATQTHEFIPLKYNIYDLLKDIGRNPFAGKANLKH